MDREKSNLELSLFLRRKLKSGWLNRMSSAWSRDILPWNHLGRKWAGQIMGVVNQSFTFLNRVHAHVNIKDAMATI